MIGVAYFLFSQSYVISIEYFGCSFVLLIEIVQLITGAIKAIDFKAVENSIW